MVPLVERKRDRFHHALKHVIRAPAGSRKRESKASHRLSRAAPRAVQDCVTATMPDQEQAEVRLEFARLRQEHADFDAAINAMMATGCDPLQIQRMKKKKLTLKDKLKNLEDRIVPDIIA